jgi:DNA-binding transcriptional MerR regulator
MSMTIGEAAARSGVPPKTIRFYEEIGLIAQAARGENRYRTYVEKDVRTLQFISRARALGLSLKDIGALLELYRATPSASATISAARRTPASADWNAIGTRAGPLLFPSVIFSMAPPQIAPV